jgi:hypothetical protein
MICYSDILQRLQAAIDSCNLEIILMCMKGNGPLNPELFNQPAEKVLCDVSLAGHQPFSFHKCKNPSGTGYSLAMPMALSRFNWLK